MAHIHSVYDTDSHFSINPITRQFKNEGSAKAKVSQFDHNSERFTFEIPRYIADGHDMSLCNSVQVHFLNVNPQTKEKREGFYVVDDLQISPEDEGIVICSWLIAKSATQLEGKLNFLIRFSCVADDGTIEFVWNTAIYTDIAVSSGIYNGDADDEEYIDILKQWEIGFNNRLDSVVSYEAQDVTDEQKEQARENIGAASKEDLEGLNFMPPEGDPEAEVRFDVAHAQMVAAPEFVISDPESSAGSILLTKEGAEENKEPRKAVMLTDPSGKPVVMSNVADPEKETDVANKKFVREQVEELSKYLEDLVFDETIQLYGAKVGQLLKVSAVDENGHPTAWEAASIDDKWEKIVDYTVPEHSVTALFNKDVHDEPFELKKFVLWVRNTAMLQEDGTYVAKDVRVHLSTIPQPTLGLKATNSSWQASISGLSANAASYGEVVLFGESIPVANNVMLTGNVRVYNGAMSGYDQPWSSSGTGKGSSGWLQPVGSSLKTVKAIVIGNAESVCLASGARIVMYGVRV